MQRRFLFVVAALALLMSSAPAQAQTGDDFSIPNGWFFTQANGKAGGGDIGFSVTNDNNILFWDAFRRFGGVEGVGYPVSDRFVLNGFTLQAFQKIVFQWRPESGSVAFLNVFDELTNAGRDDWLLSVKQVPKPANWASDTGKPFAQVILDHQVLLEQNQAIKAVYFSVSDPVSQNGLPMSAQDFGNVYVIRAQRKVFQQWKIDVPWAKAGTVVVANGGDVGKEAGLYPAEAIVPKPPTGGQAPTVPSIVPSVPSVIPAIPSAIPAIPATSPTALPAAPTPTSTSRPVPPPTTKSIYQVGETAVQNGGALTLTNFQGNIGTLINPRASLNTTFTFQNQSGAEMNVTLSMSDFVVEALGDKLPASTISPSSFRLAPGATQTVAVNHTIASSDLAKYAALNEFVMNVTRFGPMTDIRWNVRVR